MTLPVDSSIFMNSVMVAAETDREKRRQCGYPGSFLDVLHLSTPGFIPFIALMADPGECA